jgi:hypothetical protein
MQNLARLPAWIEVTDAGNKVHCINLNRVRDVREERPGKQEVQIVFDDDHFVDVSKQAFDDVIKAKYMSGQKPAAGPASAE